MGLITAIEKRMALGPTGALDDKWYHPGGSFWGGPGTKSKSGAVVSELNAMQLSIVWCCIKIISEDSASLPLHLYQRISKDGKERAVKHPIYSLLHDQPNPEMTAMSFREAFAAHLLSWGNGYSEKQFGRGRIGRDTIEALWPITPNRVKVFRNESKQIQYKINMPNGVPPVVLPKKNVLHCPGLSFDGLIGYSPIAAAREAIGLGMALEEFGELYFGNGTHPGVVVSHPGQLSKQAHENLEGSLSEAHSGLGKSHRLLLLEEAMKIEKIGIPNNEAQFLESRKFQNVDIGSRIYRLPPQMYGEYEKAASYASAEQFSIDYVVRTLRAWLVRLEQAYNMALLAPEERGEFFFEHNIMGLLRGDSAARGEFYQKLFGVGGITPNQIAELENWNPIGPEGDRRFVPLNFIPLEDAGKIQEKPKKEENNRNIYRSRLENAYRGIFTDAMGRVVRKEVKAVRRILEKHEGNGFDAALDEFYREMVDYVKRQLFPAFLSYSEAVSGMECDLNGLKYEDFKREIELFVTKSIDLFSKNYVSVALEDVREALEEDTIEGQLSEWEEMKALTIAKSKTSNLAGDVILLMHDLTGRQSQ